MNRIAILLIVAFVGCSNTRLQNNFTLRFKEPKSMRGIVNRHNYWRSKVGVSPLKWSNRLSHIAQRWANHLQRENCRIYHSSGNDLFGRSYGENIYWSIRMKNSPDSVVDAWAEEIQYFDPKTGKCKGGICGHYTQIVWKNTTKVGCAMVQCGEKEIWVCAYAPSGNWVGQKPY